MADYKGAASEASRAMHLIKKRQKLREQIEQMKQRIAEENVMKSNIDKKFSIHYDAVEAELRSSTVGLVTLSDMKAKREELVKEREKQLVKKEQSKKVQLKLGKLREKKRKKDDKQKISGLSFSLDDDEDFQEEEDDKDGDLLRETIPLKKKKLGKNPDVDTSFLPDRDREEEENRIREELRQEWEAKQEKIKSEEIEITFSYWDGSGHRRTVMMKKGNSMHQFLQKALVILRKDFSELRKHVHFSRGPLEPRVLPCLCCPIRRCDRLLTDPAGSAGRLVGDGAERVEGCPHFLASLISLPREGGGWGSLGHAADFLPLLPPRSVGVEQLMYIKEDLIIPHHRSFYDFIVTKARGKSGPLFNFDVHDDVRLLNDATVEKDESHAGKVVLRSWYEKNKHIFPANRWEPYDPEKKWNKYTVHLGSRPWSWCTSRKL
ncbi:protein FAM50A isoform X2 [Antechinus flavipes]|uniref:protein FAM50A isoform X2 n=1 Tax=Antechinus flavipes TaxID=38775 RepID=UPI002236A3E8|nr:protein FAM50A isoform X2 [Antechinus flavipes]